MDASAVVHMSSKNTFVQLEKKNRLLWIFDWHILEPKSVCQDLKEREYQWAQLKCVLSAHTVISFNEAVADVWYVKYH